MPITDQTTVEAWVRTNKVGGSTAPDQFARAYLAAESYVLDRCEWPGQDNEPSEAAPGSLVLAVCLMTARFLARRNSPDGVVGFEEIGVMALPGTDRDVERCMAPWRKVVLA